MRLGCSLRGFQTESSHEAGRVAMFCAENSQDKVVLRCTVRRVVTPVCTPRFLPCRGTPSLGLPPEGPEF